MRTNSVVTENGKKQGRSVELHGIGVSPGVVIGPVFVMVDTALQVVERKIPVDEVDQEIGRFEDALIETRRQLKDIQANLEIKTGVSDANILDAHLMVLDDRSFIEEVVERIRGRHRNAESAVKDATTRYAKVLASLDDDYLRERVADVRDVGCRIIRNLLGHSSSFREELQHKHIIVAQDLKPSETASLRKDMVMGFATELGSPTSHTALMARALEIPAIVGLHDLSQKLSTGDAVLIDGNKGVFIIRPTPRQLEKYGKLAKMRRNIEKELTGLRHEPAETQDGHRIVLSANIEDPEEIDSVIQYGAEGIGLFRSEYLFLSRNRIVGEEEQAAAYSKVTLALAPAPVIIRTLDLGGDKFFPNAGIPHEANPFLGCRSIRLSLLQPEYFKSQLRAILRSSVKGNVKIMYPMISSVGEVIRANELLEEAKKELVALGVSFQKEIEIGAMIEIPSAALMAGVIAEHVSFLSLGTNDLIQYTIAVDRVNESVAYLYEPAHPAVLKLIKHTIDAGHCHGIWVGLCGEMAADPLMTSLLVGMGVDELSVAPSAVPLVKDAIRSVRFSHATRLAEKALSCKSAMEVMSHCRKLTRETAPEVFELIQK